MPAPCSVNYCRFIHSLTLVATSQVVGPDLASGPGSINVWLGHEVQPYKNSRAGTEKRAAWTRGPALQKPLRLRGRYFRRCREISRGRGFPSRAGRRVAGQVRIFHRSVFRHFALHGRLDNVVLVFVVDLDALREAQVLHRDRTPARCGGPAVRGRSPGFSRGRFSRTRAGRGGTALCSGLAGRSSICWPRPRGGSAARCRRSGRRHRTTRAACDASRRAGNAPRTGWSPARRRRRPARP
jgi:hypothetical protein